MRADKTPENSLICKALAMKKNAAPRIFSENLGLREFGRALARHVRALLEGCAQANVNSGNRSAISNLVHRYSVLYVYAKGVVVARARVAPAESYASVVCPAVYAHTAESESIHTCQ